MEQVAKLKSFPKALYKGDSVSIIFNLIDRKTGEKHTFQVGDIIQVGIKQTLEDTNYQIIKELTITSAGTDVNIYISPQESNDITVTESSAILEVRYIYNGGASRSTVYQDKIRLEGVVVDE